MSLKQSFASFKARIARLKIYSTIKKMGLNQHEGFKMSRVTQNITLTFQNFLSSLTMKKKLSKPITH